MEIGTTVSHMFRFEEDFSEWYALCQARGHPWTRLTAGWGRLLRSPTMFEDVIKTICTTNTRWSGTKRMIAKLVTTLGDRYAEHSTLHAFPTPEAIARAQPAVFTTVIPLGYRAASIQQLAVSVATQNTFLVFQ
ncbi:MAG: hypothetical protein HYZ81_00240 [Nitrospinae bacterium]|nr:hypothetical protein [Nitrospinota bacterium]